MSNLDDVVAATVKGREISLGDLLRVLKAEGSLQFLGQAVSAILIDEGAKDLGLEATDEELQDAADGFRRKRGLHSAADTHAWLAANKLTVEELESRLARAICRDKLMKAVAEGKEEKFFVENRLAFDTARLSQIVVADEGIAEELLSRIAEEDEDFEALAERHSIDQGTRQAGGYVGEVSRKGLSPAVEAAVFGASAGEVVGPVKTDMGYHVIRIEAIREGRLDEKTRSEIADRLFSDWLEAQERSARVEVRLLDAL